MDHIYCWNTSLQFKKEWITELHSMVESLNTMLSKRSQTPPKKKCMIHDFIYMTFENRQNWSVVIDIRKMIPEGRKRRRLPGKTAQGMFCGGRNVLYIDFCCLKWMYTFTKIQGIVHVYFVRFRVYKINVNKNFLKYSFSLSWIWFRVSNLIVFI